MSSAGSLLRSKQVRPQVQMKEDPFWKGMTVQNQMGMEGERVWLNTNGERVVRKKKPKPPKVPGEDDGFGSGIFDSEERRLLLGLLGTGVTIQVALRLLFPSQQRRGRGVDFDAYDASALEGDAVNRPALEVQLEDVVTGKIAGDSATIRNLVTVLEGQGGPSLMAASRRGKWAVPWVGGWQRLTTSETDSSFLGGPIKTSVKGLELVSCRHFIYGPGEGGFINEYLYAPSGQTAESAPSTSKLLLSRSGTLDNLGDNEFEIDFLEPLQAFQLDTDERGVDYLRLAAKDSGAGDIASKPRLQTTYLSGTMWIVRQGDKFAVFQRTDTMSVNDRRGLVADGQLKPADDETIRYGRLLFGESLSDYAGWEAKQSKDAASKSRLLER